MFIYLLCLLFQSLTPPTPSPEKKNDKPARNPGPDSTGRCRRMCLMDRLEVRQGTANTVLSVSRLPVLVIYLAVCRLSVCLFRPPPSLTHSLSHSHTRSQHPYPILSLPSAPPHPTPTHIHTYAPEYPQILGRREGSVDGEWWVVDG